MCDEKQDELDRILDSALSEYSAEPRLGIEARILRLVRHEGHATQRTGLATSFWGRAFGAGLMVALIGAGVFFNRNGLVEKPANPSQTATERQVNSVKGVSAEAAPPAGEPHGNQEVGGTIRGTVRRSALPKLDVFPTPSPLTPEELALVKVVPVEEPERPENAGTVQVEPIQIQALEIKPLAVGGDEDGDE